MNQIKVAKLFDDAVLPTRKNPTDAGMDLYAYLGEGYELSIKPHEVVIVETGITVEIPDGCVGLVWPKSKNDHLIGGGVIDQSYQGQIMIKVMNIKDRPYVIKHGEGIGQLLIQPVFYPVIVDVDKEEIHKIKTVRGTSGGIVTQLEFDTSSISYQYPLDGGTTIVY